MPGGAPSPGVARATVIDFDESRGLGSARSDAGDVYSFHCSALADGTRAVEVGTVVFFRICGALAGEFEARDLVKVPR